MITVERKVHFGHGRRNRKELRTGNVAPAPPIGRVPRVSRLMALAIRFEQLLHDSVVTDQAELARIGHVSRARLTQIMNLLNLTPEIQEELLFLTTPARRREVLCEKRLRPIAGTCCWSRQRRLWRSERASDRHRLFES